MLPPRSEEAMKKYCVSVGHAVVTVEGLSRADAIQEARRLLCLDMPRMWDVIHQMDDSRFRVDDL